MPGNPNSLLVKGKMKTPKLRIFVGVFFLTHGLIPRARGRHYSAVRVRSVSMDLDCFLMVGFSVVFCFQWVFRDVSKFWSFWCFLLYFSHHITSGIWPARSCSSQWPLDEKSHGPARERSSPSVLIKIVGALLGSSKSAPLPCLAMDQKEPPWGPQVLFVPF